MMSRTPLPGTSRPVVASLVGFAVATILLASGPAASAQSGYGTIKGRLVWGGAALPAADPKVKKGDPNAKDAAVCSINEVPDEDYVVDPSTKGVTNGFVYVVGPKGSNPDLEKALIAKTPDVVIDQNGCRFVPHAVALHKDQALVFKSSDPVGHNVRYTGFNNPGCNEMVPPKGELTKKFTSSERSLTEIKCDIHPWMNGYFLVLDHPFFAMTKPDGSFEITGVPAGKQQLIVRHEKVGFVTKGSSKGIEVEVKDGEVTDLGDFKLVPRK